MTTSQYRDALPTGPLKPYILYKNSENAQDIP